MSDPLWRPEKARAAQTTLSKFSGWMASRTAKSFADYAELHRYSIEHLAEFWSALWDFTGVLGDKGPAPYLTDGDRMPGARFFPGARLNFAENLLRKDGGETALVFWGEDKIKSRLTWAELKATGGRLVKSLETAVVG